MSLRVKFGLEGWVGVGIASMMMSLVTIIFGFLEEVEIEEEEERGALIPDFALSTDETEEDVPERGIGVLLLDNFV